MTKVPRPPNPFLIISITIIVAWCLGFFAFIEHVDVVGLCQTAEGFIDLDTGASGYENALVQWEEFAEYYHCKETHR